MSALRPLWWAVVFCPTLAMLLLAGCTLWKPEPRIPFPDLSLMQALPFEDCAPELPVLCLPVEAVDKLLADREKLAAFQRARQRLLDGF